MSRPAPAPRLCERTATSPHASEREAAAIVLINVYWHLRAAELILQGAEPRDACAACCQAYYVWQLPAYLLNWHSEQSGIARMHAAKFPGGVPRGWDIGSAQTEVPRTGPHRNWTHRCFVTAVAEDKRLLATPWADLTRSRGIVPRARIHAEHLAALRWQVDMMRLMATGAGTLLHSARVAHDRANHKPARRREPADPAWLAGQLGTSLTAAWDAIRNADDGHGQPFWIICPPDHLLTPDDVGR